MEPRPRIHLDLTTRDEGARRDLCRAAEEQGSVTSVWLTCDPRGPDPLLETLILAGETKNLRFTVAYPPGLMTPVVLVHQFNTVSAILEGRIALALMCEAESAWFAAYAVACDTPEIRNREYLEICLAFWQAEGPVDYLGSYYHIEQGHLGTPFVDPLRSRPEIHLCGNNPATMALAAGRADRVWLDETAFAARDSAAPAPATAIGIRLEEGPQRNGNMARYQALGITDFRLTGAAPERTGATPEAPVRCAGATP